MYIVIKSTIIQSFINLVTIIVYRAAQYIMGSNATF